MFALPTLSFHLTHAALSVLVDFTWSFYAIPLGRHLITLFTFITLLSATIAVNFLKGTGWIEFCVYFLVLGMTPPFPLSAPVSMYLSFFFPSCRKTNGTSKAKWFSWSQFVQYDNFSISGLLFLNIIAKKIDIFSKNVFCILTNIFYFL